VRRDLEDVADATGDASESTTIVERDEKTYPARRPKPVPSILVRSARDEARARAALATLGDEAPGPDLRRSEQKARLAALARRRSEEGPARIEGSGWEVRTGDLRAVLADLPDQSIDAIVCDPPYNREGLPSYSALSELVARLLKPRRLCVAYCGKTWLPDHFDRLATPTKVQADGSG
jgi:16S rRNA G966 N2-methylase RsmD